ncbi:MAG: D-glycero-beta-D-manno-heptose 1-phosphate adenylyltransferase [Candidatus Omnitrophota bacterium]|jgi:D-beta-D-heptose 7-phosphate kinase/D-beta-D-heptose 1-phosphate adenosyltransferase
MNTKNKILSLDLLKKKVAALRKSGKKIVFTNGCFDLLHFGHVSYLEEIKSKDAILIVGLNSDSSIRSIKAKGRPIQPQKARARVLAALACVDYVTIFSQKTPYRVIKALQPDVLVKGADWKGKMVVGEDIVKARGGRVKLVSYVDHFSTTHIIKKILTQCAI